MKTKLVSQINIFGEKVSYVIVPQEVLDQLGWKAGDGLTLDIPMVHGGMLCVEKKE